MISPSRLWIALKNKFSRRWHLICFLASVIAGLVSFAAAGTSLLINILGPEKSGTEFYGRWLSEYEYAEPPAMVSMRVISDFYENGTFRVAAIKTYNFSGKEGKIAFRIDGAGTWEGNDEWLITTLNNSTDFVHSSEFGKTKLDATQIAHLIGTPDKLSDHMPKGMPERYEVLSIEPKTIGLRLSDLDGEAVDFDMIKTQKRIP